MDCCQLEESVQGVKREEAVGDSDNGPPDTDNSGGPPQPPRHNAERTEPTNNTDSASNAPVPTSDVTHLTRLSDTQPIPLHTNPERTSPMPARRLKKRKHTTDCEEESTEEDARRKASSNPAASNSPVERDLTKTTLTIPEGTSDATSVRDLENAMSKHLPSVALDGKEISHRPTDFSTDALLKQQQQKSTIQWIGTQNHHINYLNRQLPGNHNATPSASALLRQLYANRESVIRSNVLGDGRTGGYYSSDGQTGPLPTPPGSEGSGYGEQLGHKGTELGLAYGSYAEYHSMTPPGSVSPRDKQQYPLSYDNSAYSEALRHSYLEPPLPLKPQAYSAVPGALDYASSLDQSQFFHPPSSFHLYHPQAHSAHPSHSAHQADKTGPPNTNWYSSGS